MLWSVFVCCNMVRHISASVRHISAPVRHVLAPAGHFSHMMTSSNGNIFRVTGPFVRGIHRLLVNSPHKGQWRGGLMFSLTWINGWANNSGAGDLRHHRAHCDVTVMLKFASCLIKLTIVLYVITFLSSRTHVSSKWHFKTSVRGTPLLTHFCVNEDVEC